MKVLAANYPFATIDPSDTKVVVPDARFDKLCEIYKPKSKLPPIMELTDIAGLVKGASEGAGLGNAFLSHIQAVDAIYHVCRAFRDKDIEHVEASVDPVRDLNIISNELVLKDLALVTKNYTEAKKLFDLGRDKSKEKKQEVDTLAKAKECLEAGTDIREYPWEGQDIEVLNRLQLLTAKPIVYLVNISKKDFYKRSNKFLPDIAEWVKQRSPDAPLIPVSVTFEEDWQQMSDEEKANFKNPVDENIPATSMVPKIITTGYHALRLIHYFTCGQQEVRGWTIKQGTLAPQAAGVIHTDFIKNFISAEIITYEDLLQYGSEKEVKAAGKLQQRGKDYEILDGDICHFKIGQATGGKK